MKRKLLLTIPALLLAPLAALAQLTAAAGAAEIVTDPCRLEIQAGSVNFQTDSIQFQGGQPSVELMVGKNPVKLTPVAAGMESKQDCQTPMGSANARTWTWHDARGYAFTWTITRLAQWPGYTVKMTFSNQSKETVRLQKFVLCQSESSLLRLEGAPGDWFMSTVDSHDSSKGGFHPSGNLATDTHREFLDTMTLFAQRGAKGLVMGAVGPAESDIRFSCDIKQGQTRLRIDSEMNDILVDPGETRRSEEVLVLATPYETALTHLFHWMATTHGARITRGPIVGWCSWYFKRKDIHEKDLEGIVNALVANRNRLPMQVVQIDDGWQKGYGDWKPDLKKFPNGMKPIADKITAAGMIPGVWLGMVRSSKDGVHPDGNPAEYLDSTYPQTRDFIRNTLRERYAEGYRYFKLDFNWPRWKDRYNQKLTRLQVMRGLFQLYRESIGEDSYLCACVGGLNRGALGYADGQRISSDSEAHWDKISSGCCIPNIINGVGSLALANGILFAADPDVTYTVFGRFKQPHMADTLRAWHGFVGLLGGFMMTSEMLDQPPWNSPDSWRMMEILNPPAPDKGRAFDGQTDPWHRQFGLTATRPWGNFVSTLLFNPSEAPADIPVKGVPLAGVGKQFHVWSFWDEKYLGIGDETFAARNVPVHGAALLRLTELAKDKSAPVLVGSNLHISMGSAEIKDVQTTANTVTVTLTDAGAREGKLFFYSLPALKLAKAEGCTAEVASAGENLWSVAIAKRERGKSNWIRLEAAE